MTIYLTLRTPDADNVPGGRSLTRTYSPGGEADGAGSSNSTCSPGRTVNRYDKMIFYNRRISGKYFRPLYEPLNCPLPGGALCDMTTT